MTYLNRFYQACSSRSHVHWSRFRSIRLSPLLVVGCAALLVGCDDGAYPSNKTIRFDEVQRDLNIQPIQVCNDFGQDCARVNLFAEMTARILEQARLKVNFLPTKQLHESRFLTINDRSSRNPKISEFTELARSGGSGAYGRHPESTRDSGPINVWFVDEIESSNGYTQFGLAYVDGNGVLISEATLDHNGGKGRLDTLAHEIGHNLGLSHSSAGDANNLLASGSKRNVPGSLDDVYPNGAGVSKLTLAQLTEIVNSPFVNPHAADDSHTHTSDDFHAHASGFHTHASDGFHTHASDGLHVHTADNEHLSELAADLSSFTIAKLQIGTEADTNRIPEPSTWGAIALIGLSSLLLVKRQKENALSTAKIPVPVAATMSCLTANVSLND